MCGRLNRLCVLFMSQLWRTSLWGITRVISNCLRLFGAVLPSALTNAVCGGLCKPMLPLWLLPDDFDLVDMFIDYTMCIRLPSKIAGWQHRSAGLWLRTIHGVKYLA